MRILLLTDSDVFAGTERHMLELAIGLRAEGTDVRLGCPGHGALAQRGRDMGLSVVPIAKGRLFDSRAVKGISRMLKSKEVQLVHAHNGRTALIAAMAVARARVGHCVMTQHFLAPSHIGRRGVKGFVSHLAHRWVAKRMSQFVAISEAVRRAMLERHEASESLITVVHNGVSEVARPGALNRNDVRQELCIALDAPLVACAARLEQEKDLETLIIAMESVVQSSPRARCIIAGQGSQEANLRTLIAQHHLENAVTLLGFRSDVPRIMDAADLFVLPSVAEPFGLVLLEAMALGKPVIATRVGGPVEIVEHGKTGLLVPPSDSIAMAAAILPILQNSEMRDRMGEAGRLRFLERFTAQQMAHAMVSVYRDVLGLPHLFADSSNASGLNPVDTSGTPKRVRALKDLSHSH